MRRRVLRRDALRLVLTSPGYALRPLASPSAIIGPQPELWYESDLGLVSGGGYGALGAVVARILATCALGSGVIANPPVSPESHQSSESGTVPGSRSAPPSPGEK